ncbi:hypothetical protein [Bacillus sp. V33-4]|uniref:hypothetical protein n=1 Tax=Bacillus sp. V33-4 TaxID=2054169 RepID=UPI000C759743|nr:hypothetical protein [Bacillus sp. V33-4]PLR82268.1 hypothetical protein CVD23_17305 [Bacillus sp. V33-4]
MLQVRMAKESVSKLDMGVILNLARSIVFNCLFIFYIIQLVLPIKYSDYILSICSFFALILSLQGIQVFYQIIVVISLSFSFIVMYLNDLFTWNALTYFSGMTNILVLLAYASLLSIPVLLGEYPQKIYRFFRSRITSFKSLYATFSIVTFILCSVMTAPAIPTIQASLSEFLKKLPASFINKFQSITYVRPFIMTLFWTPVAAAPTIAITGTGAKASIILPLTFTIAILFLLLDIQSSFRRLKGEVNEHLLVEENDHEILSAKAKMSLIYFLLHIVIFIVIILSLSHWLTFSMLDAVVLMIIPYSFIWALFLQKGKSYCKNMQKRLIETVPNIYPQVALFVAMSVFINVIAHSHINDWINGTVYSISITIGPFILLVIGFVVFLMTWIGIIPQLVVVLATQTLSLQFMNVSAEWLALAILGGALTGSASSPFTMNANIVAMTINESPMQVVKHNLFFALIVFIVTSSLSILMQIYF